MGVTAREWLGTTVPDFGRGNGWQQRGLNWNWTWLSLFDVLLPKIWTTLLVVPLHA